MRRRLGALPRRGVALLLALLLAASTALLVGGLGADLARAEGPSKSSEVAESLGSVPPRKVPGPSPAVTLKRFLALTAAADTAIRQAVKQGEAPNRDGCFPAPSGARPMGL